jgi:hypothetical protein
VARPSKVYPNGYPDAALNITCQWVGLKKENGNGQGYDSDVRLDASTDREPCSKAAEETAEWLSRPAVALPVLVRWLPASDALLLGRRVGFRHRSRLDFRLSSEYGLRRHIGRGCGRGSEDLYRVGMPRLGQTLALGGDDGGAPFSSVTPSAPRR